MYTEYNTYKRNNIRNNSIAIILLLIASYFAAISCKVNVNDFLEGIPNGLKFIGFMFPPDWAAFSDMLIPAPDFRV